MRGGVVLAGVLLVLVAAIFWGISWVGVQACLRVTSCSSPTSPDMERLQLGMSAMDVVMVVGGGVVLAGFLLKTPRRGFRPTYRPYAKSR